MKKRVRKQSSARVSSVAARVMRLSTGRRFYVADHVHPWRDVTRDVLALAASCLSQDEQGKRGRKR